MITGKRPIASVRPSTRATLRGPIQAAATPSQIEARVMSSLGSAPARAGIR
jgi:hypothetical protein